MGDIYNANEWFSNILIKPHRAKLQQERARTAYQIEQKEEFIEDFDGQPHRAHAVGVAKAELAKLKATLKELDTRLAKMWQSPPKPILDRMQQLHNTWTHFSTQAAVYGNYSAQHLRDEKPIAAKNDANQSAEYRKIADTAKTELDRLQAVHKVPDGPDEAERYGFVEFTGGGSYRVIL